ncbi:MAG TPA: hypothetical protein VJI71_02325 [Candidatus Norongarragalinales archaeon]|nr:hypothetical protein [Candidatus Norongarragalinales archaeon]
MRIVGGRVENVSARKLAGKEYKGISTSIRTPELKEAGKTLEVSYSWESNYEEGFADMKIEGIIIVEADDKERKEILDNWKKDKTLPIYVAEEVLAAVNYTTSAVGTLLAFAVNVSAPVAVSRPKIIPAQENKLPGKKAG